MKKSINIILIILLFLNLSSVLIKRDGSSFDLFSYSIRIALYFYVLYQIFIKHYPKILKKQKLYQFCCVIPFILIFPLLYSALGTNDWRNSISSIFPTYFLLSNNIFFLYVGYYSTTESGKNIDVSNIFHNFALLSIIGMTFITIYVVMTYGNLMGIWELASSEGGAYNVFLNAYKNVNPYKFAILIPFLFLKKCKYNLFLAVLCVINIFIAGKKGPLVGIIIVTTILYLFVWHNKKKVISSCIYAILVFVFYIEFIDDTIFNTLIYRLDPSQHYNASADISFYSSGRDHIWQTIFEGYSKSHLLHQIFGHGTIGAYNFLLSQNEPNNAHNTWLEILYNFGGLGVLAFLYYYTVLMHICLKMKKFNYQWKSIAIFLVLFSFLSTFYTVTYRGGFAFSGYSNMLFAFLYGHFIGTKIQMRK